MTYYRVYRDRKAYYEWFLEKNGTIIMNDFQECVLERLFQLTLNYYPKKWLNGRAHSFLCFNTRSGSKFFIWFYNSKIYRWWIND